MKFYLSGFHTTLWGREVAQRWCVGVSMVSDQESDGSHHLSSIRFDHVNNSLAI